MEWVLVILYFADGGIGVKGPFATQADCVRSMASLAEWAASLPEPMYHLSTCKKRSEVDIGTREFET